MADGASGLDDELRRADPDRWLTSRFIADPAARADVAALYAFDHELARARRVASSSLLAEIRLTWWREALDEIYGARPVRRHPTARALEAAVRRRGLPRAPLEAMIDGQVAALELGVFDEPAALAWADGVEGSVAEMAAMTLDPTVEAGAARSAGRAWGLALSWRAGTVEAGDVRQLLAAVLTEARADACKLSPAALPAALPARLARFDLLGRRPGPLVTRIALTLAVATGRI